MLSVRLRGPSGKSVKTTALVDSGATTTFVPPDFVGILDLVLGDSVGAMGAGGDFDTNLSDVVIEIMKGGHVIEAEVHVPAEEGRVPYVVLGRDTVFLAYDITFRENKECFTMRKPKRGPDTTL